MLAYLRNEPTEWFPGTPGTESRRLAAPLPQEGPLEISDIVSTKYIVEGAIHACSISRHVSRDLASFLVPPNRTTGGRQIPITLSCQFVRDNERLIAAASAFDASTRSPLHSSSSSSRGNAIRLAALCLSVNGASAV